jgi:hypothetical protein
LLDEPVLAQSSESESNRRWLEAEAVGEIDDRREVRSQSFVDPCPGPGERRQRAAWSSPKERGESKAGVDVLRRRKLVPEPLRWSPRRHCRVVPSGAGAQGLYEAIPQVTALRDRLAGLVVLVSQEEILGLWETAKANGKYPYRTAFRAKIHMS